MFSTRLRSILQNPNDTLKISYGSAHPSGSRTGEKEEEDGDLCQVESFIAGMRAALESEEVRRSPPTTKGLPVSYPHFSDTIIVFSKYSVETCNSEFLSCLCQEIFAIGQNPSSTIESWWPPGK